MIPIYWRRSLFWEDTGDDRNENMDIEIFSKQILFTVNILILLTLIFSSVYQPVCQDITMIDWFKLWSLNSFNKSAIPSLIYCVIEFWTLD